MLTACPTGRTDRALAKNRMRPLLLALLGLTVWGTVPSLAQEHPLAPLSLFDPPTGEQAQHLSVKLTPAWLDMTRRAALRVGTQGGAFVSSFGLIATQCSEAESQAPFFYAPDLATERPLAGRQAFQWAGREAITTEVPSTEPERAAFRDSLAAVYGASTEEGGDYAVVLNQAGATLVADYYRVFSDLRLVFNAEVGTRAQGAVGALPRLAVCFLRAYDAAGEPVRVDHFFEWSMEGVKQGEATFSPIPEVSSQTAVHASPQQGALVTGVVAGQTYAGQAILPFSTLFGLYERLATEDLEVAVEESWAAARAKLDLRMPLNFLAAFATTTEAQRGAAVINQHHEWLGLTLGTFADEAGESTRAVVLDVRGLREALQHVYEARRLLLEGMGGDWVPTEEEAAARMQATEWE